MLKLTFIACALLAIAFAAKPKELDAVVVPAVPVKDQVAEPVAEPVAASDAEKEEEAPAEAEPESSRLFATVTTTTVTKYLTAGTCSVTTSCAALVNATSKCRRRRGVNEQPIILAMDDDVQPSAPLAIEPSVAPSMAKAGRDYAADIFSSNPDGLIELEVTGLKGCGQARNPQFSIPIFGGFAVSVIITSSVTSACSATSTKINTYTVSGCSPSGIVTCTAASG